MTTEVEAAREVAPILARILARIGPSVVVDGQAPALDVAAVPPVAARGERSSLPVDQDVRAPGLARPPAGADPGVH